MSKAAIPLRRGHDIDVPEMMLKVNFEFVRYLSRGKGHAARMLTPGPIISGLRMPGLSKLGPLEEKEATMGDNGFPMIVPF